MWTFRWQGPHRATVRAGLRSLSSCLPFLLRFIFLARERGKRWWRVRPSSLTTLPHSSHLSLALSLESSLVDTIPKLYERLRERPRRRLPRAAGEKNRVGVQRQPATIYSVSTYGPLWNPW